VDGAPVGRTRADERRTAGAVLRRRRQLGLLRRETADDRQPRHRTRPGAVRTPGPAPDAGDGGRRPPRPRRHGARRHHRNRAILRCLTFRWTTDMPWYAWAYLALLCLIGAGGFVAGLREGRARLAFLHLAAVTVLAWGVALYFRGEGAGI